MPMPKIILTAVIIVVSYVFIAVASAAFRATVQDQSGKPINPQVWLVPCGVPGICYLLGNPKFWADPYEIILPEKILNLFSLTGIAISVLSLLFLAKPVARVLGCQLKDPNPTEADVE